MKFSKKTAGIVASSLMVMSLATLSAFGDSRPQSETWRANGQHQQTADRNGNDRNTYGQSDNDWQEQNNRGDYDRHGRNDRGDYDRNDRDDRGDYDRHDRDDRGGYDRHGRNDRRDRVAMIAGIVERIDYRRDLVILREARSGRPIVVDMDRVENCHRGADLNDLRRGDFVRLTGEWDRGGFEAYRIDDIRSRRRW